MKKILLLSFCLALFVLPGWTQSHDLTARLTSESNEEIVVVRGMPVILHFRIYNNLGFSFEEAIWSIPDSLLQDPEVMLRLDSVFAPILISKPGIPWYNNYLIRFRFGEMMMTINDLHIIRPLPLDTCMLDYQDPLHLFLGIDPSTTKSWKAGDLSFRIGIPLINSSDTLWSNSMVLKISKQIIKSQKKYTSEQQYQIAQYWLLRGDCKSAAPLAEKLYATDTTSMGNTILMARVAECGDKTETALHYYYKAYEQYMRQPGKGYEPPDLLMMKIGELQEKFYLKEP
jgi:hypothetical protein